ncbi:MAG: PQQ-binding-like beta-propeller repeat protein [Alphaproteobacteria bacterium]
MLRTVAIAVPALFLGACSLVPDWLGEPEAPPLPGERISVLALERTPEPDPRIADLQVRLPRPTANSDWPQFGGYADHAMHHIAVSEDLTRAWKVDIGEGGSGDRRLLSPPVVAAGQVYALDARGRVSAVDAASGRRIWRVDTLPKEDAKDAFGGGLAFAGGRVYVATGTGDVVALDPAEGREIWRRSVGGPARAAPAVSDGKVFVVTYDNQLFALDAGDGRELWSHSGIAETAQLMGAATPAAGSGLVIAAYSSGEVFALRADNGRVLWSDALAFRTRMGALASLADINGSPVIDRDRVYAVSHAGRLVAISLRTGDRLWDQEISGTQTPWVAGDFLFVLTVDSDLLCLSRRDGRIRWVRPLPRYKDPEDRRGPIFWSGPVLASDRLIVVGSHKKALSISPYTGKVLGNMGLPGRVELAPVIADGTVYILTDGGDLVALR